jgi:hypothetical protein
MVMQPHGISRSPVKKVIKEEHLMLVGIQIPPALNKIIMQMPPPLMTLVGMIIHPWVMITHYITGINKLITQDNLLPLAHLHTNSIPMEEDNEQYYKLYAPCIPTTLEFTQTLILDRFHPRNQMTLYASALAMSMASHHCGSQITR